MPARRPQNDRHPELFRQATSDKRHPSGLISLSPYQARVARKALLSHLGQSLRLGPRLLLYVQRTHTDSVSVCQCVSLSCSTELNSNWIQLKQNLSELWTNSTQAEFTSNWITPAKFQCKALENNGQVFVFPYPAVWGRSSCYKLSTHIRALTLGQHWVIFEKLVKFHLLWIARFQGNLTISMRNYVCQR